MKTRSDQAVNRLDRTIKFTKKSLTKLNQAIERSRDRRIEEAME